jgi:hypothetical protein
MWCGDCDSLANVVCARKKRLRINSCERMYQSSGFLSCKVFYYFAFRTRENRPLGGSKNNQSLLRNDSRASPLRWVHTRVNFAPGHEKTVRWRLVVTCDGAWCRKVVNKQNKTNEQTNKQVVLMLAGHDLEPLTEGVRQLCGQSGDVPQHDVVLVHESIHVSAIAPVKTAKFVSK